MEKHVKKEAKPVKAAAVKAEKKIKKVSKPSPKALRYFEGVGRRKTSIARVRIKKGEKGFSINGKTVDQYFPILNLQEACLASLKAADCLDKFSVSVRVKGGGISSQAGAVRHGVAKALLLFDPELRNLLKKAGYLTRDPRMRERKKFGLKRARRAPQWQKR